MLDGWVLRFTRGFTKRANSVTPLYPSSQPPFAKVRYCEDLYAREGQRTIFRMTTVTEDDALDELLASRGYETVDPTRCSIAPCIPASSPCPARSRSCRWRVSSPPTPVSSSRTSTPPRRARRRICTAPARCYSGGDGIRFTRPRRASRGLRDGRVEREVVGLFDIVVHPRRRRRGHGRMLVEGLLGRACEVGAQTAYLQVLDSNAAALRLYGSWASSRSTNTDTGLEARSTLGR